jgi:hypothetical protein
MALYTLRLEDGTKEYVRAPPNATREELAVLLDKKLAERKERIAASRRLYDPIADYTRLSESLSALPTRDTSIYEDFTRGFGAGAVGMAESSALGIASLMEEEDELKARRKIQSTAREFMPTGGDPDSITYGLGQALGSIAGLAAPVAGLAAAGAPGLATLGTGLALAGSAGAGEASERARAGGATQEERESYATPLGWVIGFTELIPVARFVKLADVPALNKLVDKFGVNEVNTLGDRVRNASVTAGYEGAQEAAAEFFQNAVERGYNLDQEFSEGLVPAAGYGAGAGAIIQTVTDLFTRGRRIGERRDTDEIDQDEVVTPDSSEKTLQQIIDDNDEEAANEARTLTEQSLTGAARVLAGEPFAPTPVAREDVEEVTGETKNSFGEVIEDVDKKEIDEKEDVFNSLDEETQQEVINQTAAYNETIENIDEESRKADVSPEKTEQVDDTDVVQEPKKTKEGAKARVFKQGYTEDQVRPEDLTGPFSTTDARSVIGIQVEGERFGGDVVIGKITQNEDGTYNLEGQGNFTEFSVQNMPSTEAINQANVDRVNEIQGREVEQPRKAAPKTAPKDADIKSSDEITEFRSVAGAEETTKDPVSFKYRNNQVFATKDGTETSIGTIKQDKKTKTWSFEGAEDYKDLNVQNVAKRQDVRNTVQEGFLAKQPTIARAPIPRKEAVDDQQSQIRKANVSPEDDKSPIKANEVNRIVPLIQNAAINDPEIAKEWKKVKKDIANKKGTKSFQTLLNKHWTERNGNVIRKTPTFKPDEAADRVIEVEKEGDTESAVAQSMAVEEVFDSLKIDEQAGVRGSFASVQDFQDAKKQDELRKYAKDKQPEIVEEVDKYFKSVGTKKVQEVRSKRQEKRAEERAEKKELKQQDIAQMQDEPFNEWYAANTSDADKTFRRNIEGELRNWVGDKDPLSVEDNAKIQELLQRKKPGKKTKEETADWAKAQIYFSKFNRPADSLYLAISDKVNEQPNSPLEDLDSSDPLKRFFAGTGHSAARKDYKNKAGEKTKPSTGALVWARENLSADAVRWMQAWEQALLLRDLDTGKLARPEEEIEFAGEPYTVKASNEMQEELEKSAKQYTPAEIKKYNEDLQKRLAKEAKDEFKKKLNKTTLSEAAKDDLLKAYEEMQLQNVDLVEENLTQDQLEMAQELAADAGSQTIQQNNIEELQEISDEVAVTRTEIFTSTADNIQLQTPLHAAVVGLIKEGNVKKALETVAFTVNNPTIRRVAKALARVSADTKIKVIPSSQLNTVARSMGYGGEPVSGLYFPKELVNKEGKEVKALSGLDDTVLLSEETGLNVVTFLHEVSHAATLKSLSNPNAASTKRLQQLFEYVKANMESVVGTENLAEFVAEAYTNPIFQQKLARLAIPENYKDPKALQNQNALGAIWAWVKDTIYKLTSGRLGEPFSVLDETNVIIAQILSSSRANASDVGPMFTMAVTDGTIDKAVDSYVLANRRAAEREKERPIRDWFNQIRDTFTWRLADKSLKQLALYGMNSRLLSEVGAAYKIPQLKQLHDLIGKQERAIQVQTDMIKATALNLEKWKNSKTTTPERYADFNELMHYSSIEGVNLGNDADSYGGDKRKWYDANIKRYEALGEEGQKQYQSIFQMYQRILQTMQTNILKPLESFIPDQQVRDTLKNKIIARLFDRAKIDPYIPLTREGKYWLQYDVGGETVYQTFNTEGERNRFRASIRGDNRVTNDVEFDGSKRYNLGDISPNTGIGQIIAELRNNGADENLVERIIQMYIESMPDSSFIQSLQTRDNKAGFQMDVLQGINIKAFEMARQAVNIAYTREIYQLKNNMETDLEERHKRANFVISYEEKQARGEKLTPAEQKEVTSFRKSFGDPEGFSRDNVDVFRDTFAVRAQVATNPSTSWMERLPIVANQATFLGIMGGNISSAVLQLAGLPMILWPMLSGKTSMSSAGADIYAGMRIFAGSGLEREVPGQGESAGDAVSIMLREAYVGAPSIENFYKLDKDGNFLGIRKDLKLNDDPKQVFYSRVDKNGKVVQKFTQKQFVEEIMGLVQLAANRGLLNRTIQQELQGQDTSGQKTSNPWLQGWKNFSTLMSHPFHIGDRGQRQISLVASYLNEVERLNNKPNKAKGEHLLSQEEIKKLAEEEAIKMTELTSGTNLLGQAPPIAQKSIGRMMMMFRTYGATMYYLQTKQAVDLYKEFKTGKDKEAKMLALKQLIGVQVATAAMAGLPMLTPIGIILSTLDYWGDEEEETYDAAFRQAIGEGFYKGGVNFVLAQAGLPIDLSQRIGLAHLILGSRRYDFDRSLEESIVEEVLGAPWSTLQRMLRGKDKLLEGEFQRGVEDVLPISVRNMMQAYRFANEGALTRRGDPITQADFNSGTIAAKFLGFAPAEYTFAQERAQDIKRIDKAVTSKKSKLLKQYYIAQRMGDMKGLREVKRDIQEFNTKHRKNFPDAVIDTDTINRSMKMHMRTSEEMFNGVQLSPSTRDTLKQWAESYDRGAGFL